MRDLFLGRTELTDDSGQLRRYEYYVTVDETEVNGVFCGNYGIRVEEQGGEAAAVRGITCSASRIDELAELILRNKVTPITLGDVIADQLAQESMFSAS